MIEPGKCQFNLTKGVKGRRGDRHSCEKWVRLAEKGGGEWPVESSVLPQSGAPVVGPFCRKDTVHLDSCQALRAELTAKHLCDNVVRMIQ